MSSLNKFVITGGNKDPEKTISLGDLHVREILLYKYGQPVIPASRQLVRRHNKLVMGSGPEWTVLPYK